MSHPYLPNDGREDVLLSRIGKKLEDLYADIPENLKLKDELRIPRGKTEFETWNYITSLLEKNRTMTCFMGGGCYPHYIPSHVRHLLLRSEFYTSYTPYQPEISQGMLQALFEFQSMMAELYGMDAANSSMYDGATALAEAVLMAMRLTKRKKVIIPFYMHPDRKSVLRNYLWGPGGMITEVEFNEKGEIDLDDLLSKLDNDTAAVVVENPSFVGTFQPHIREISELTHDAGAKLVVYADPLSLGVVEAPGKLGADIAVGDGQTLGIPMSYGGPSVGIFTCKYNKKDIRQAPGRFVGMSVNKDGERVFTLTLQSREQAIRRASATSNICSNQALCAVNVAIYLASLGPQGLRELAETCMKNTHYLMKKLNSIGGLFAPHFAGHHFMDFVLDISDMNPKRFVEEMMKKEILPGIPLNGMGLGLENSLLVSATEIHTREMLDRYVEAAGEILG